MALIRQLSFLLIVLTALQSCAQVRPLEYRDVQDFRVHKADLQQATIVVQVRFYNPNGYSLVLKDGDIDAYFNDHYLGKALLDERTPVPAKDTFLLPVTITARLGDIFTNALGLLGGGEVLVRLQGTVKAGKGGIFVRIPVHYEERQHIAL